MAESTRVRKYTAQLVILEEPEIAGEIRAWAERLDHLGTGQNLAPTLRELVRAGLAVKRGVWETALGPLSADELVRHVENSVK
jgi:hypothetical protein